MKKTLKNKEIQNLIKKNKTINVKMIFCFFSFNNKELKFSFSSSKIFKNKPVRNKIKRQLRSIVFKINDWPLDLNLFLIAKKNFYDFNYDEICKNINIIKKKIKKIKCLKSDQII